MHNLILLIVCFTAGVLLKHFRRLPESSASTLNGVIIHVSLPAVTLLHIHDLRPGSEFFFMAAMPWIHFFLAAAFFLLAGRLFRLGRTTVGALILTGGLGNTSFVGLPMIEAFFGKEALVNGIIVDQMGSFMVLSTLGLTVAGIYAGHKPTAGDIVKRIVMFPPFIALLVAVLFIPFDYPQWLTLLLQRLGDTLAPLALLSVGFQLQAGHLEGNRGYLALGLGFKLILAPLLIGLLYVALFGLHGTAIRVTLFEAAMPPMITAGIIASEYNINPPLSNMMVVLGIILSFVSLPIWSIILSGL